MADSLTTTLLENVAINLKDSTNYTAIAAALSKVIVAPEFVVLPKVSGYAVVVLGPSGDEENYASSVKWVQPVTIYFVVRRLKTRGSQYRVLGTSAVPGLDTLIKDAAQALCRPSPYSESKPSGGYTTQTGVLNCEYTGKEILGEEDFEEMQDVTVGSLTVSYLCFDTRAI